MVDDVRDGLPFFLTRDAPLLRRPYRRDAELHQVRRGVYLEAKVWAGMKPWERYAARVEALALMWDAPVFCLESAAVRLGVPLFGEPRDIHVVDSSGKSRRYGDVVVHATSDDLEVMTTGGVSTTSYVDTALALCRVLPPAFALAVADKALRSQTALNGTPTFGVMGRERADRRGLRQLDWIDARATATAESVGESVSRAVIEWLGFEAPELQVEFFHEGARDRSDFYFRRRRIVAESDGYGKYDAHDPESAKAHFVREKIREDRLRRHEGGFARWDWADTLRSSPLGDKLHAAGLTTVRPREFALLRTLRHNPR
ncbi:hypothetical protein [Microbacterium pygmaeum]|uniref:Transcriptional regulator, AbiEi antitoxin, Type IV TA system n=1 Tax=Microbacterium pygmaeum TaxID=370764 RepID=A0A1G7ZC95_9MICO|nr:hypothetical protein [Microbacterium pygmaeum]SDH06318.1 Transcriptional regulator, AbiEi antitoxin, Type IV TA system [Microbacterium pygmaeum]